MIYERAYGKINLALQVGGVKEGYHEVINLMLPISLYDELFFEKNSFDLLECEDEIEDNLCKKAIQVFKEKYGISEGVHLILKKRIPIMAGLAGGSTDAAATLRGLNRLFEVDASEEELFELACMLGSDVPFFLKNKAAICTGRGEICKPLNFDIPNIPVLLIKPDFGCSTKQIYDAYQWDGIDKRYWIEKLIQGLKDQDINILDEYAFNDLDKTILKTHPKLNEIYEKIKGLSYVPHISGSGPTIFILDAKQVDLENVKAILNDEKLILCRLV